MNSYTIMPPKDKDKVLVLRGRNDELLGMLRYNMDGTVTLRGTVKLMPFVQTMVEKEEKVY